MKMIRLREYVVLHSGRKAYWRKDVFVSQQLEVAAKSQIGL